MKRNNLIYSCASLLLLMRVGDGQTIKPPRLVEGVRLQEQGKSREAVQVLTLFLHDNPSSSGEAEGVALNALGSTYQDFEHFEDARHSYDRALLILGNQANAKREYASTLDNLGSLDLAIGNTEESKRLRKRAHALYEQLSSHSGLCRTSNNLAVIAFTAGKLHEADAYLNEAFEQTASATDVTADDLASMYNLRGRLAENRKDFGTAISAQKEALRLWLLTYSPTYYKIAIGYTALASAETRAGDSRQALFDVTHALSLEADSPSGKNSRAYLQSNMVYAQALKLSGHKKEAALIEAESRAKLAHISASTETVSAESLAGEQP